MDDPFHVVRPAETLGVYVDGLDRRFRDMEKSFQEKLQDAMKWEDSVLRKYADKARLEKWVRSTAESAEAVVAALVDEETRAAAEDAHSAMPDGEAADISFVKLNGTVNGSH